MSPRWNPKRMIRSALRMESIWTYFLLVPLGAVVLTLQNGAAQQQSGQQQQQPGQQGAGAPSSNGPNGNGNAAGCSGGANNSKPAPLFCGSLRITKGKQAGD